MKKTKMICMLGAALMLAGCGNAYANISHGNDVVVTVGDTKITDGDLYPQMKAGSGTDYTLSMIREKIYENEVEVTDDMKKKAQDDYDSYAEQAQSYYGMTMEEYVQRLGYTDKEEYIKKVILPTYEQTELNKKYFEEDNEEFMEKYQPVKARIFATSEQDQASQALDALKDGEDFQTVVDKYGDTSTYKGNEQLYYTDSGLPSVVMNKLKDAKEENKVINEVIVDSTTGTYYIAYFVSNDYDTIKDDIISTLAEKDSVTSDCMVYFLKKYNFTVYDTDIFNSIKTSYPQYLVQRPDIAESASSTSSTSSLS